MPSTRLRRMRALTAPSSARAAMLSPARWTTASTPSSARGSSRPRAGSHWMSVVPGRGGRRLTRSTRCPAARSAGTSALPTSPVAPVTATRSRGALTGSRLRLPCDPTIRSPCGAGTSGGPQHLRRVPERIGRPPASRSARLYTQGRRSCRCRVSATGLPCRTAGRARLHHAAARGRLPRATPARRPPLRQPPGWTSRCPGECSTVQRRPDGREGALEPRGERAVTRVLVTMPFSDAQLDRIRAASPRLTVTRADAADGRLPGHRGPLRGQPAPRTSARAPDLRWVQLHMAGVNALQDHPLYRDTAIPLTTTSGVHAATIAEYAITVLLALAHRVPRMVEWQARKGWPPDEERWPLFVPTEIRGATLGVIGYGSIGRELARIATSAFGMTVLACKRDPRRAPTRVRPARHRGPGRAPSPPRGSAPPSCRACCRAATWWCSCAPLTAETRHLIDRAALAAMKPTAYFINVGRGATRGRGRARARAGGAPDRRRGDRRVRRGAAAGRASLLRPRQRDPVSARVGVPAELRRPVRGAVRREPAPLPGGRAAPEPRGPGARATDPPRRTRQRPRRRQRGQDRTMRFRVGYQIHPSTARSSRSATPTGRRTRSASTPSGCGTTCSPSTGPPTATTSPACRSWRRSRSRRGTRGSARSCTRTATGIPSSWRATSPPWTT